MKTCSEANIPHRKCSYKIFYIMFVISLISLPLLSISPQDTSQNIECEVKAAYIYNFTKFLQWPQNNSNVFCITVLGKNNISSCLNKIAAKEKVNGKKIVVKVIQDLSKLDVCEILYLPAGDAVQLTEALKKTKGKKIVLIASSAGFAERGAAINLVLVGEKIKFEINKKALEEEGIIPNSGLLTLAYKVYE